MRHKKFIGLIISLLCILCFISPSVSQKFSGYVKHYFWINPQQEKIIEINPPLHTDKLWFNFSMDPDFILYLDIANEKDYKINNWTRIGLFWDWDVPLALMPDLESNETYYLKFQNIDTISSYMEVYIFIEELEPPEPHNTEGETNYFLFIIPIIAVVIGVSIAGGLIIEHRRNIQKEVIKLEEPKIQKITHCQKCGTEIIDKTDIFCSVCGNKIIN